MNKYSLIVILNLTLDGIIAAETKKYFWNANLDNTDKNAIKFKDIAKAGT